MALADDLLAVLDDPTHMWSHALKELSNDGQRLFLTLTLLPEPVSSDVLQVAYTSQKCNRSESFLDSLRSLEDSFITIEKRYGERRVISFRNPSLEDFAKSYLDSNSDWLDILLSSPKYYEQVLNAFGLAQTQSAVIIDGRTLARKDNPKYAGIKSWVERRASELIETAVGLLEADRAEIYVDISRSRLSELLRIIAAYGIPTEKAVLDKLQASAEAAVNPSGRESANVVARLLSKPIYRGLLDKILQGNATALMRANILDKDSWKFTILSKLDTILELDAEETWHSWGDAYVDYARGLAQDLANSDNDDDLHVAIEELNAIGHMLGADLYDEIHALEKRRLSLPDEDDYNDVKPQLQPPSPAVNDDSTELDGIFTSLL